MRSQSVDTSKECPNSVLRCKGSRRRGGILRWAVSRRDRCLAQCRDLTESQIGEASFSSCSISSASGGLKAPRDTEFRSTLLSVRASIDMQPQALHTIYHGTSLTQWSLQKCVGFPVLHLLSSLSRMAKGFDADGLEAPPPLAMILLPPKEHFMPPTGKPPWYGGWYLATAPLETRGQRHSNEHPRNDNDSQTARQSALD
ncbi:hypothetical protein B0T24DRAFT_270101 [Lasiosphaeria ovina]|uniref:Uncharacterized protein n=1 Tax=Lasiosphaeria ovina TaxID=92902 RepID=A0AAE0KCS8_9PEZI|nr:hypothetical protein B0T24DRAFT_270101 [Lasiosphaeria ovina]